jgi:pSer/pThr/pTyr-binding forkhead associated (FHA) protein
MPEGLLAILKFAFLAILWLFFVQVIRVAWAEIATPAPAANPAPRSGWSPAPAAASEVARLVIVQPPERQGLSYEVGQELTVGRANGCQVALPDDRYVSQVHARIYRQDGQVWLEDLGSTNGSYVNSQPVRAPVALRRGDWVQVGRTVLEVSR